MEGIANDLIPSSSAIMLCCRPRKGGLLDLNYTFSKIQCCTFNAQVDSVHFFLVYIVSMFVKNRVNIVMFSFPFSALPLGNWSVSIENTTATSTRISWQTLTPLLGRGIQHYIVLIKSTNGSILNGNIVPEDTTSDAFYGLSPFKEYQLSVVGADDQGSAYKSNEVSVWTDEGGTFSH